MKFKLLVLFVLLFTNSLLYGITFNFEGYALGKLPEGWSHACTDGGITNWQVLNHQGNHVLSQTYTENKSNHFNIVFNSEIEAKNIELSVKIQAINGKKDRGGGLVFRYQDPQNYYVVRVNSLENNVVLYKVEDGVRTDLPLLGKGLTYGAIIQAIGNEWCTLKVTAKEDIFTIYLDNKELFIVQDETFKNAGKVGLWTKSDAVSYFDDFKIDSF
jgi:hypothetical protein